MSQKTVSVYIDILKRDHFSGECASLFVIRFYSTDFTYASEWVDLGRDFGGVCWPDFTAWCFSAKAHPVGVMGPLWLYQVLRLLDEGLPGHHVSVFVICWVNCLVVDGKSLFPSSLEAAVVHLLDAGRDVHVPRRKQLRLDCKSEQH